MTRPRRVAAAAAAMSYLATAYTLSLPGPSQSLPAAVTDRRTALGTALAATTAAVGFGGAAAVWAADSVTVQVDGQPRTFPAVRLPLNFAEGLKLPIRDITEDVFGLSDPLPADFPLTQKDLARMDESDDGEFYNNPRFVYHIDGGAVAALTNYYKTTIPGSGLDVLDICSSWVSYYPEDFPRRMHSIVGTGMNALELQANQQLTSYVQRDLNKDSTLPFSDNSFDVVTCVVSVDYLTDPLAVFKEVRRVLKPGGRFVLSQSNRLFMTKAIRVWVGLGDLDRLELIGTYFYYAGGFGEPKAFDISAKGKNARDPMYIVEATKV